MEYTLYYWGGCTRFWGRAIGPVLTLQAGGKVLGRDFSIKAPSEAPAGFGAAWPQLQMHVDGLQIAQAPAILDVLGERLGLSGSTPRERILCKQYLLDINDVFGEASSGKLANPKRKEKWLPLLEARLERSPFFIGDTPTIVDFHAVFAFEWVLKKGPTFDEYPHVTAWWDRLRAVPVVKAMYDSCTDGLVMIP